MEWWWRQFDAVIRARVRADPASMRAWNEYVSSGSYAPLQKMCARGQIGVDDPVSHAVWEAFLYQRAHIDAFTTIARRLLTPWQESGPARTVGIIDVGCGTGTVAFAFDELFEGNVTLCYVGVDHHQPTLTLCKEMVGQRLGIGSGGFHVTPSVTAAVDHATTRWPPVSRAFVTCSYLLNQTSLTDQGLQRVAAGLARFVRHQGLTWFIVSDAAGWKARPTLLALRRHLEDESLTIVAYREQSDPYTMRYPDLTGEQFRQQHTKSVEGYAFVAVPVGSRAQAQAP